MGVQGRCMQHDRYDQGGGGSYHFYLSCDVPECVSPNEVRAKKYNTHFIFGAWQLFERTGIGFCMLGESDKLTEQGED